MIRSLCAPGKYVQGSGAILCIADFLSVYGTRFLVILDPFIENLCRTMINQGISGSKIACDYVVFQGEATQNEAERIKQEAITRHADGVIGMGGGKVLDTAKNAADMLNIPVIIIPTSAASDAPCSAVSVIYDDEGTFLTAKKMKENPSLVLVDSNIIAQAPRILLLAGIGDALATYYEARACRVSGTFNNSGCMGTEAAFTLAALCHKMVLRSGRKALDDLSKGIISEEFDNLIEANIYLSGVGFENNGCAVSHGFYNGLTAVLKPFPVLHGIGVAYGTLIQLILERTSAEEWNEIFQFYKDVGLPTKLSDIQVDASDRSLLRIISDAVCSVSPLVSHMPFDVDAELIYQAMIELEDRNQN